ncbi:MAG: hypothetical protein J6T98_03240 [Salinivirgaceae bacterium]|jgi:hypothetical protein|nr:hypothetical protein [Salinivirgaceae bacterium]
MKRLILLVLATFVIVPYGRSQERVDYPKNQISASYSAVSFFFILDMPNDVPEKTDNSGKAISKKDYHEKIRQYYGIYNVQYMRTIKSKLEIGLAANYERIDRLTNYVNPEISCTPKDRFYRVLCVAQYNFLNKEYARAYAKGGAGVGFFYRYDFRHNSDGTFDDDTFIIPCIEGLAGIEYGPGLLRPFIEVGFGAQGIVSFGLRTRF